jgi:nitroreductase
MDLEHAILTRRSHKLFDGTPIARQTLTDLVALAVWAPNHKRTEPWRFAAVHGERLRALREAAVAALQAGGGEPEAVAGKVAKLTALLDGAGAVVAVSWQRSPNDGVRDREDYAATACAAYALMLGAHGRGLASYLTTSASLCGDGLRGFWHLEAGEELLGVVVLGGAAVAMPAKRSKTAADLLRWV